MKFKFGVSVVTETWANEHNESLLTIPGYRGLFENWIDRRGGGVALFIDDYLSYTERNDRNEFAGDEFESCFIELDFIYLFIYYKRLISRAHVSLLIRRIGGAA